MPVDVARHPFAFGQALLLAVLVNMPGDAPAQTVRPSAEVIRLPANHAVVLQALTLGYVHGISDSLQTGEVIVSVEGRRHSWIACGTESQIAAQRAAHQAHGHNHDFTGPCAGSGLVISDNDSAAGSAGSGNAAASADSLSGSDPNANDCVSSGNGLATSNCHRAPLLAGQQIRRQFRNHLPLMTPTLPPADEQETADITADPCGLSDTGPITVNCQAAPSPTGRLSRRQLQQQSRYRLPLIAPGLPSVKNDEEDEN
jgi:hypothetical protein